MTTDEGNKIIAEHRGAVYEELLLFMQPNAGYVWKFPEDSVEYNHYKWKADWPRTDNLLYNKDWNWLMPVVKKLMPLCWGTDEGNELVKALINMEIEPLWEVVVRAIENTPNVIQIKK